MKINELESNLPDAVMEWNCNLVYPERPVQKKVLLFWNAIMECIKDKGMNIAQIAEELGTYYVRIYGIIKNTKFQGLYKAVYKEELPKSLFGGNSGRKSKQRNEIIEALSRIEKKLDTLIGYKQ
jgi:hypothetical protein